MVAVPELGPVPARCTSRSYSDVLRNPEYDPYRPLGRRSPFQSLVNCIRRNVESPLKRHLFIIGGAYILRLSYKSMSFMAQTKLLVTFAYAVNAFGTIPNDPFPDCISNFLRFITGINPFLSQFPAGSSLTVFRPELPLSPLIVVTRYSVPCHFVGGICHDFEINCSAPAR